MALLVNESSGLSGFRDFQHRRPMMLKDFLRDDYFSSCATTSSSSSIGFPMSPRQKPSMLLRSQSKRAAATTISAIHKVVNVVKLFQLASVKSPSVLRRSTSRKLPNRSCVKERNDAASEVMVKVKVKDILRWRSFRDLEEDNSTSLDFPSSSPSRTATASATSTSCSQTSSWCNSESTAAEELPDRRGGENEEFWGKKSFLGQPVAAATDADQKEDWSYEESESPVSVLYSPFQEVEDYTSPFRPITLPNVERAKCMLTRRMFDQELEGINYDAKCATNLNFGGGMVNAAEEKARQLLSNLKEPTLADDLILDFFVEELVLKNEKVHDLEFDSEILRTARSWMNGELDGSYEWEMEDKRKAYVKDMEKGVCWSKFGQEQEEISKELEAEVLDELVDDLLADFLSFFK